MRDFVKHLKSDLLRIQYSFEVDTGDTLLVYDPGGDVASMFKIEDPDEISFSEHHEYYLLLVNSDELEVGSYVRGTDGTLYMRIVDSEGNPAWLGVRGGQEVYSRDVIIKQVLYEA